MITLQKLKQQAKRLKTELYALYLAYRDPRVPWYARAFAACVVAYAFSPIDLIPDPIPILGYLDDLILVPLGIKLALKMIPPKVMAECRVRARSTTPSNKPKNWFAAGIIVILWVSLAVFALRFALHFLDK
ncbi:YkvA family protein [Pannus brasiliensis CCIBt3594]|uniref:YkvA family protein n=1 Tax=Pannus brasiliensis CCIBt3594 TaxID=1427578 RepID=A0AAW9QWB0_9CHRO